MRCSYCDRVLKAVGHSDQLTVLECPELSKTEGTQWPNHEGLTVFDPKQEIAKKYS